MISMIMNMKTMIAMMPHPRPRAAVFPALSGLVMSAVNKRFGPKYYYYYYFPLVLLLSRLLFKHLHMPASLL